MPTNRVSTQSDPLLVACSLIPAAYLCTFYGYVVRARFALGEWPLPYRPDPKDLGFLIHHGAVAFFFAAAIFSPLAFAVCLLVRRLTPLKGRPLRTAAVVFAASYVALWVVLMFDPGSFLEWYAD